MKTEIKNFSIEKVDGEHLVFRVGYGLGKFTEVQAARVARARNAFEKELAADENN